MNLKIGENIRRYRREKSLSQEMLAERLGVSFQAVSKWERSETYPDVTLLPAIASFFHISVDELLGTEGIRESEEVDAIVAECAAHDVHYAAEKLIETVEAGLKRFPNNFTLLSWYVYAIQNKDPKKCVETCRYILDNCTDQGIRNWVQTTLCYGYFKSGNREKAVACARELPSYYGTMEDTLRHFLEGDALKEHIQDQIVVKLAYEFWLSVRRLKEFYGPAEQIALFEKSNAVYDAIYETNDVPFVLTRKMRNYQGMAEICLKNGMEQDAFDYMREAAACAVAHDALPETVSSRAMLFDVHPYDRRWESKENLNLCGELLRDFETEDEFYGDIRGTAAYGEIVGQLKGEKRSAR
ncbi:MAG: helix-turn-helix transcriptional regulator [Ruminococcaceae bacterium]|nr:helix-turn-helix transcriptional regulator [Oscillospiraceae bacterium]